MAKDKPPVSPRQKSSQDQVPPEPPVFHLPDAPSLEDLSPAEPPEPPVFQLPDAPSLEDLAPPDPATLVMRRAESAPQPPPTIRPEEPSLVRSTSVPQPETMPPPRRMPKEYSEADLVSFSQTVLENNVSNYLKEVSPVMTPVPAVEVGSLELNNAESFRKAIEYCACEYDKAQGVSWRIIGDHLIRDARGQNPTNIYTNKDVKKAADAWAYTGQFLNSCRAARIVVNLDDNIPPEDKVVIIREISALANMAFNEHGKPQIISQDLLKTWNTEVAKIVYKHRKEIAKREGVRKLTDAQREKYRIDDTTKDIMAALDCAGLEDIHYHLTTISQVEAGGKKISLIETSQKLSGQTLQTKNDLAKIASGAGGTVPWFNALAPFDQKIIQESCWKIREAQGGYFKVIPTQFMEKMAGLRNAYLEARYTQSGSEDPQKALQSFRSSTPSFHGRGDTAKVDVTRGNIDYLNSLDNEGVCLNILFTPTPIAKIEKDASGLLNNLSDNLAETPTNIVRSLQGSRDLSGFEKILNNIVARLNYGYIPPYIKTYIRVGGNYDEAVEFCYGWSENPLVKEAVMNLIECRNLINDRNWAVSDVHYNLAARMAAAVHDVKRGVLSRFLNKDVGMVNKFPISEIDAFCKSGKDRTGIAARVSSDLRFEQRLRTEGIGSARDVYKVTVSAGHQQALNGRNGGTPLCYGVKGEIAPSMPERYRGKGFARETADTNKFPCKKLTDKSVESSGLSPRGSNSLSPKASRTDSSKSLSTYASKSSYSTPPSTPHAEAVRQSESPRFHFPKREGSHVDAVLSESQSDKSGQSHAAATKPRDTLFQKELAKVVQARSPKNQPSGRGGGGRS